MLAEAGWSPTKQLARGDNGNGNYGIPFYGLLAVGGRLQHLQSLFPFAVRMGDLGGYHVAMDVDLHQPIVLEGDKGGGQVALRQRVDRQVDGNLRAIGYQRFVLTHYCPRRSAGSEPGPINLGALQMTTSSSIKHVYDPETLSMFCGSGDLAGKHKRRHY